MISLGSIGKRHLRNTRALLPDAEIGLWRQHTEPDGNIPEGVDRVFKNLNDAVAFAPDAVIVSSPASEHISCAVPFVKQGAALFMEKPLSDEYGGLNAFKTLVEQSASIVMIGYVLRFLPALEYIRKMIAENTLGKIYTAHVEVGQYLPDWRPDTDYRIGVSAQKQLGGGCLLELSHELDYATWLLGMPDHITASVGRLSDLDIDVEDSASVIMEYGQEKTSKRVHVQLDFLQRVANMYLEVVGEFGTLKADLIKEEIFFYSPSHPEGRKLDTPKLKEGNEIYIRQFDFFFDKAFEEYNPVMSETKEFDQWVNTAHAVDVMRIIEAARESANRHQRISMSEISS